MKLQKFPKKHINLKKIKKSNSWIIIEKSLKYSFLISNNLKRPIFFKFSHIQSIFFYIKKIISRKLMRPFFLIKPTKWITTKSSSSRMGKGKGSLSIPIFILNSSRIFLKLPLLHILCWIRFMQILKIRLPFSFTYIPSYYW